MITIDERGMKSSTPMALSEITDLFCAALTGGVAKVRANFERDIANAKSKSEKEKLLRDREVFIRYIFDSMNNSFSVCLSNAFPEYELHPELTEEAILKAENEILEARVKNATIQDHVKTEQVISERKAEIKERVEKAKTSAAV